MADCKASVLISWAKGHVGDGYVYGTTGQTCIEELLRAKERQYGAAMGNGYYQRDGDYSAGRCARWLGHWVTDCSGLIKRGRQELGGAWRDVSAQGTYDQCGTRGEIGNMPLIPGCLLFMWSSSKRRMSHVGVYIGDGWVIEARGVAYGVVKTKLSARAWGYWGLPDWLDYDLAAEDGSAVPGGGAEEDDGDATNPKPDDDDADVAILRKGDHGQAVRTVQTRLNAHGCAPALAVDGDFGSKTDAAVRWFQRAKGLSVDGIAGPRTWAALLSEPATVATVADHPLLRRGSTGSTVRTLQRELNDRGEKLVVDGDFGAKTEAAVKRFQRAKKLVGDGLVGPKTWAALLGN